jgi:hypothetical protein
MSTFFRESCIARSGRDAPLREDMMREDGRRTPAFRRNGISSTGLPDGAQETRGHRPRLDEFWSVSLRPAGTQETKPEILGGLALSSLVTVCGGRETHRR